MTVDHPTADIELAELAATIEQAAARLLLALGDLRPAWTNISNGLPGYRSALADHTQPESFEALLDDPSYKALRDIRTAARDVLTGATTIREGTTHWATGDKPPPTPARVDLDMWCTSCLRADKCNPTFRGELCRWCYEFNQIEHQRPPVDLLRAHHDGRTITAKMVDDALGANRKKPRR